MLGKIEGRREWDDRGWDDWMASSTQWTWIWANSGKSGMLQSIGSQRVRHNWSTEKIRTVTKCKILQASLIEESPCLWNPECRRFHGNFNSNMWEVAMTASSMVYYHNKIPPSKLSLPPLPSFFCEDCQMFLSKTGQHQFWEMYRKGIFHVSFNLIFHWLKAICFTPMLLKFENAWKPVWRIVRTKTSESCIYRSSFCRPRMGTENLHFQ